jgi:hypothetical protein
MQKNKIPTSSISLRSQQNIEFLIPMVVLFLLDLSGRKIKTMKILFTLVLVQLVFQTNKRKHYDRTAHKIVRWLLHAKEKLQHLLYAHRIICFCQNFSTVSTAQAQQQSRNWQQLKLNNS